MWATDLTGWRLSLIALALVAMVAVSGAEARSYEDVTASGFLSVGVYRDFPPYSFEEAGEPRGVDVEIGRAMAEALGVELKLHWMLADENLDDDLRNHVWKGHYLGGGVADVMLRVPYDREYAYRTDPDGRVVNDLVHMFGPYQAESWALAFDPRRLEAVPNLAIFQYEPVGVEIDSLPDFYLSGVFRGRLRSNVRHYPTLFEAASGMGQGQVAAVMGTRAQVEWAIGQAGAEARPRLADIPFPGMSKQRWQVGMAVKENHRQLAYAVSDVVAAMIKEGRMQRLFDRYGLTYQVPEYYLALP